MTDLVSQNVEVILNRKTNMEAVIKIIEENIPEVISLLIYDLVVLKMYFFSFLKNIFFIYFALIHLNVSCQLNSLNLSNNRIHKLDEFAELVTKVPQLKTLNLSHNEVAFF